MRKLFTLFSAMLAALAVNAATINISPTSPNAAGDNLRRAIKNASAGDIIVLEDGIYKEEDQIELNKDLTIQASEGAHPVIAIHWYCTHINSAKVTFKGICFAGDEELYTKKINEGKENEEIVPMAASDHCIRPYDATEGKSLTFENCEFKGFPSYIIYPQRGDRCIDAIVIRNCYFHDNVRSAILVSYDASHGTNVACNSVTIENSTFANFTNVQEALISIKNDGTETTNQKVVVDHCTFYNFVKNTSSGYTFIDVRKATDVAISNCIFAQPEASMSGATYVYGGSIDNCLTFNTTGHRSSSIVHGADAITNVDPLFVDAANGNYTLSKGSPALTAGSDGKAIGDPRWVPVENLEINFMTNPYTVTGGALPTAVEITGTSHNDSHGYNPGMQMSIPIAAGNYKITVGTCQYGNGMAQFGLDGLSMADIIGVINTNDGTCYHQNTTTNVACFAFAINASHTLVFKNGNYTPYFKLEKLADDNYPVIFVNDALSSEGSVPAEIDVTAGNSITIPQNRTLYKKGYTLTGWSDGDHTYAIGSSFTPTSPTMLSPIFEENEANLLTATSEVTAKWYFGESNGAPSVNWQGAKGIVVTQATVGTESIDVKLDIDATSGKFSNSGRGDEWAQVNAGTTFSFPSKKGITVAVRAYNDPTGSTLDGNDTYTWAGNVATFSSESTAGTSVLVDGTNTYFSYLEVSYPASSATSIDNANANAKAVKSIVNGMLIITRDGKTYNVLGTMVK